MGPKKLRGNGLFSYMQILELVKVGYRTQVDNLRYLYGAEPHIHYMTNELHFDIVEALRPVPPIRVALH